MTTFSEDVLLQVSNVRHKKGEGILYVMSERVAFILQNSETVSVSHPYTDIKTQKISSEFKTKVQLQLVFHDGSTSTFQFTKSDRAEALRDRDKIKEFLFEVLPKFQKKVNKELEEKNRILSENPMLLQLYRDLVITQVISAEEFWQHHAPQHVPTSTDNHQNTGVSANFLVNIKPQVDGCNSVKYNLNYETIQSIFKTYPAVKKKHIEYVPHKLSESEFWKKFFESHYFHKDRINSGMKDLFSECAKYDDQELKKEVKTLNKESLINLNAIDDVDKTEGYGVLNEDVSSNNVMHESIIKRFNQHSIMVLKASNNSLSKRTECVKNSTSFSAENCNISVRSSLPNGNCNSDNYINKKLLVPDNVLCNDLASSKNDDNSDAINFKLTNVECSVNDLSKSSRTERIYNKLSAANSYKDQIVSEIQRWSKQNTSFPIHPTAAVNALGELTPGSALMKNLSESNKSLAQPVPLEVCEEFQNLYMALGELLRHFWSSFPPTTPTLEETVIRTHDALRRFHSAKLKPFEDRTLIEHSQLNQISSHLNLMINSAYNKFAAWQCRRK